MSRSSFRRELSKGVSRLLAAVVDEDAIGGNMIDMLAVDFQIENAGFLGEPLDGGDSDGPLERAKRFPDLQFFGEDKIVPFDRKNGVIGGDSDRGLDPVERQRQDPIADVGEGSGDDAPEPWGKSGARIHG